MPDCKSYDWDKHLCTIQEKKPKVCMSYPGPGNKCLLDIMEDVTLSNNEMIASVVETFKRKLGEPQATERAMGYINKQKPVKHYGVTIDKKSLYGNIGSQLRRVT